MILTHYAIRFRTAVLVFIAVMGILGVVSYINLPREGAPDITIPYVFVTTAYQGVAPAEIENLVTIPFEKRLNELENVKEMRSTSSEGLSTIVIEFTPAQDINSALQRVKDKIDLARPDVPDDIDEPLVQAINFSTDIPILMFAISGNTSIERLKNLAEDLQDRIETLPGVKDADIYGTREREIRVEIDLNRLIALRIPLSAVLGLIAAENSTVSAGNLEIAGSKFQLRVPGEFALAAEMKDLVVASRKGEPVYLRDVAQINDTYKDLTSISRLNRKPCVSIQVKKRSGENTVALIRQVKQVLENFRLPPGVKLTVTRDQSEYIASMINELENNILSGLMLVVGVLLVCIGLRNSIFVGIAIPLSLLISFIVISLSGLTLNMIVLFSLVMAVGMLVDNAIVIVENIYRRRTLGESRLDAARRGASEVAWPVLTSTLTTVVAFWPILYWPGIIGQFMSFLPRTLIITISASLFVALVINPAVCSFFIQSDGKKDRRGGEKAHPVMDAYERLLRAALSHRVKIVLIAALFFALTIQLYQRYGRGLELFPTVEPRSATVTLRYPQGTSIEKTDAALQGIEEILRRYPDIKFFLTNVGAISGMAGDGSVGTHIGAIEVEFLASGQRAGSTMELVSRMRADIGAIPGAEIKVERQREGPPAVAPVSIEVSGEDFDTLSRLAGEIAEAVKGVPGLVDVQDDLEEARPEIQFHVDRQRAALLGLSTDAVGHFLRSSIFGATGSKFRAGEDEYDITVRLPENARNTADLLDRVFIPLPSGAAVPLSSLGSFRLTGGRGNIMRKNQKRVITITGDIQQRSIDAVLRDVRSVVAHVSLPRGYSVAYSGENKDMKESAAFLSKAFGVAVGLIAVILVVQFNSAFLPLIIMSSVLLSLIGVMWGLLICRMRFGVIMTGLGVISLAGVVVNNAIVLMDCTLQRRQEGLSANEAVVAAGRLRLRPVLLTAVTTILGLIPMAIGWSVELHSWPPRIAAGAESSQWWAPMAVAVIFGLGLATILTLVVVPVLYSLSESLSARLRRRFIRETEP